MLLPFIIIVGTALYDSADWGFFAHKKINRYAVFTLPPEMMCFFKPNIEFLTEHAPDPDKRKFIDPHEAIRHYIDIDKWGEYPFEDLPRTWLGAMKKYVEIYLVEGDDKILLFAPDVNKVRNDTLFGNNITCLDSNYSSFIYKHVAYKILKEKFVFSKDSFCKWLNIDSDILFAGDILVKENFSKEGIAPYHLYAYYKTLVKAFKEKNPKKILRRANDIGHYIADSSVPLHTTENYNGQLTGQIGIHAFWENRIPEELCNEEFDFFVGKAEYIENVRKFFWDIILTSHVYKDKVLEAEMKIRKEFPDDRKFVFAERNGAVTKMQSREYTIAFNRELSGMVEERMKYAVKAIGNVWYSAWIDAGQPDLRNMGKPNWNKEEKKDFKKLNSIKEHEKHHGREHWD